MRLVFCGDLSFWYPRALPFVFMIAEGSDGRWSEPMIQEALKAGHYWLALAAEGDEVSAAMIAQPIERPGFRELWIWGLVGERMETWLDLESDLRRAAKGAGFSRLTATARPGWSRLMKPRGWQTTHVEMSVDL